MLQAHSQQWFRHPTSKFFFALLPFPIHSLLISTVFFTTYCVSRLGLVHVFLQRDRRLYFTVKFHSAIESEGVKVCLTYNCSWLFLSKGALKKLWHKFKIVRQMRVHSALKKYLTCYNSFHLSTRKHQRSLGHMLILY